MSTCSVAPHNPKGPPWLSRTAAAISAAFLLLMTVGYFSWVPAPSEGAFGTQVLWEGTEEAGRVHHSAVALAVSLDLKKISRLFCLV